MSNNLTNLIPDTYAALDVVSRELTGFLPGVQRDAGVDRVAVNQSVRISQAPANSAGEDITPAMSDPSAADQTIGNATLTISKQRAFPFSWSGEEQHGVNQGPGYLTIKQGQIAQALRAAVNEVENDLADAAAAGASRAYGTAGTTPFASTLADPAQARKILDDNGAPMSGRSLVIDTAAGANLRTLAQLTKANEAGSAMTLRDGELLNLHGFSVRESAQINNATAGTGASYLLDAALSVGDTTISVDTGSGTILAGDVVTIGNHKYVAATALSGGDFTIASPGIREAVADNAAITVNATSARNVAFSQDSLLLAARLPMVPEEGDKAIDSEIITDPRTGLSFELRVYPGYRMNRYEIALAWGVKALKSDHIALLLG
jgi:hypothetical protein